MPVLLSQKFPLLRREWGSNNHGNIDDYKAQSGKKFEWICCKNSKHIWEATLQSRTIRGTGCPFCSNQRVIPEESFAAKEDAYKLWHPNKNSADPFTLSSHSTAKKHWWQCMDNPEHEWQTTVASVVNGSGCPFCAGQKVTHKESFGALHPNLTRLWHPNKNTKTPFEYTPKSERTVWWRCDKNPKHEWKGFVASVTKGGGCPFCAGKRVLREESFGSKYPLLLDEWHPTKNKNLDPFKLSIGSSRKAWWVCKIDSSHVFEQPIHRRVKTSGNCPFCIGKLLTPERSLAIVAPNIAAQWYQQKNGLLTPKQVFANSNKKYWWQCDKNPKHIWDAACNDRLQGKGCPFCRGLRVNDTNSLVALRPEIAKEWHPHKNGTLKPDQFSVGSGKVIWWQCEREESHEWRTGINNRTSSGTGCPYCTKQTSAPEIRIYTELSAIFSDVRNRHKVKGFEIDVFIPELAVGIEYDGSYWHKGREEQDLLKNAELLKYDFTIIRVREKPLPKLGELDIICSPEEMGKVTIDKIVYSLLRISAGNECEDALRDYLTQKDFLDDVSYRKYISYFPSPFPENSLEQTHSDLSAEWHFEKNFPLTPLNFSKGSKKKVWWKCGNESSHEWETTIQMRTRGSGCPHCARKNSSNPMGFLTPQPGYSLADAFPEVAEMWHPFKNLELSPDLVAPHSNQKVWWRCVKNAQHEWQQQINLRVQKVSNGKVKKCPFCTGKRINESNCLSSLRPELAVEWHPEKNGRLTPNEVTPGSPKSVWWLCPVDTRHVWKTRIQHRSNGSGCPFCSGRKKLV